MRIRVEEIFHEIADLSAEERSRYFAEHRIDVVTRKEVEELAAFDSESSISLKQDIGRIARHVMRGSEPQALPCGPYQLGKLLGRGGMGSVYSAERADGEIAQRVAVKLLRPGADDSHSRERFLLERQILASLSHPNIAQLLDAGHRDDGQPYLAMEYIEGKNIDVYASKLSIRDKVALFLKVCGAVSYLHRNLVVHRDLKPANILVTDQGEPKLLDFGIAKLIAFPTDSTATAFRMLTPDFASPEQVTGGAITTAADIYSLGAVLYKLLTGVSPHLFEGNSAEAVGLAICLGDITPPSRLVPALKGDLEIVLMKALRKEPQERYASVDALADDLRAWLDWRPVHARSADVWYRTRRLLRRHWAAAAAALLVTASLSTGLYVANRQRAIAERRFGQLQRLSNKIIDLDTTIRTLPGSIDARQRLVSASLEYLEGLSREAQGDLDLAQEISDGYWRMARIQGVNAEFNLGDPAKAEDSLKKAEALIETVLASRPHDRNALFRSAVIAHDRMIVSGDERRPDALVHARKAAARLEEFLRYDDPRQPVRLAGFLRPGDPQQSELRGAATLYSNIALAYVNLHLFDEGIRYARRSVALSQPIPSAQDIASGALSIWANALRYQGDLEGALRTIRQARSISEKASYPSETARVFNLYGLLLREGRILGERGSVNLGRPAEAAEVLQRALDINEDVARKDARDSASRGRVGSTARELGDILMDLDPPRALAVFDLGIRRVSETQNSLSARRERAELLAKSTYPLRRLHRFAEARNRMDSAIEILTTLKDYPAERVTLGSPSYSVLCALGDEEADTGHISGAIDVYEKLLHAVQASNPKPDTILQDAARLSHIRLTIAHLYRRAGRVNEASSLEASQLELWRHWDAKLPNNSFVRRQLAAVTATVFQATAS